MLRFAAVLFSLLIKERIINVIKRKHVRKKTTLIELKNPNSSSKVLRNDENILANNDDISVMMSETTCIKA